MVIIFTFFCKPCTVLRLQFRQFLRLYQWPTELDAQKGSVNPLRTVVHMCTMIKIVT